MENTNNSININSTTDYSSFTGLIWQAPVGLFIASIEIVANLALFFTIVKSKNLRTKTNHLLLNMTVSETFYAMMLLFEYSVKLKGGGNLLMDCKLRRTFQDIARAVNSFTLVAISYDRYLAIVKPLKYRIQLTRRRILITLLSIWTISIITITPMFHYRSIRLSKSKIFHCFMAIGRRIDLQAYKSADMLFVHIVPLLLLWYSYIKITQYLWFRKDPQRNRNSALLNYRKRVTKRLGFITLVFNIVVLPSQIISFVRIIFPETRKSLMIPIHAFHLFSLLHPAITPFFMFVHGKEYRKGFYRNLVMQKRKNISSVKFCRKPAL